MQKSHLLNLFCAVVFCVVTVPSQAALIPVLGGQAFYDDQLDITWAANANLNERTDFATAESAATALTIGGIGGWRLPSMDVNNDQTIIDCSGVGVTEAVCRDNEYGHLYYYGAGTTFGSGITSASTGPFSNVMSDDTYWSSTNFENPDPPGAAAWKFDFNPANPDNTRQDGSYLTNTNYAWAVHTGMVPLPATLWLFGSGLIGLITVARQHRQR